MTTLDEYLERILKSAGSSLLHYTPQSKENLRSEMKKVIAEIREEDAKLIDEGFDRGIASKHETCAHGKYQWEDCESCAAAAIRAEIAEEAGK